jgi:heme-degrading monooxygenase HmoA
VIARVWFARATLARSPAYVEHFSNRVLPDLRALNGFAGCSVSTQTQGDTVEIMVVTHWKSLTAIKAFAGNDHEAAVVAPEAAALLTDYDRRVRHFEIALTQQ